jgi:hypothetical protein
MTSSSSTDAAAVMPISRGLRPSLSPPGALRVLPFSFGSALTLLLLCVAWQVKAATCVELVYTGDRAFK